MSELWFYGHEGTQRGPVEIDALRTLAASGELLPTDLVWREGMTDWAPAHTVPGLFAAPVSPPPAMRPTAQAPLPLAYDPGAYRPSEQNGRAVASLVLGICSMPACVCPFVGVVLGVTAIALGAGVRGGPNRGLAVAGVVCGAIGALMGLPQSGGFFWR